MSISNLIYMVEVQGLEAAQSQADSAAKSADIATASLERVTTQGVKTLPLILNSLQTVNALKNSVESVTKAIQTMNPWLFLSAALNILSVVTNLMQVLRALGGAQAAAAAGQAVLATLSGQVYLIPLALAMGALVATSMKSFQIGGPVNETGVYMLHKGEYVIPANQVSYGPIYVNFGGSPTGNDVSRLVRDIGPALAERIRRGF